MASEGPSTTINGPEDADIKGKSSQKATEAVLRDSAPVPENIPQISGIEYDDYKDRDIKVTDLLLSMENMGFQASEQCLCPRI